MLGETRDRILAAAAALGYDGPHPVASSLRSGRSGIVGIVVNLNSHGDRDDSYNDGHHNSCSR